MGRDLYGRLFHRPEFGRYAAAFRHALGPQRHSRTRPDDGSRPSPRLACGRGALARRGGGDEPGEPPAPTVTLGIPWMATHVGFMGNLRPRVMDKADIRDVLRWQAEGARKARSAGFDIVYVYAGMGYLGYEFLLPEYNHRCDEYGGPIENRIRFVRELLEVTRDAVGTDCGVALRVSLEELRGRPGVHQESEAHELISLLSDHADLFDVKMDFKPDRLFRLSFHRRRQP